MMMKPMPWPVDPTSQDSKSPQMYSFRGARCVSRTLALVAVCFLGACAGQGTQALKLEGPSAGLDQDLDAFDFSEEGAWSLQVADSPDAAGPTHWLELSSDAPKQRYNPPHRSPHRMALLKGPGVGDFRLEFDALSTGRAYDHRDLCVFFAWQDPACFHYLHLAPKPDPRAHNFFLVNYAARRSLEPVFKKGLAWPDDTWVHLVVERRGNTVVVHADGVQVLSSDKVDLGGGRVGVGSFDDSGRFANMTLEEH